jgi:threonine/homoserine/homoserine lactone efflux protein
LRAWRFDDSRADVPSPHTLLLFFVASAGLVAIPGPAVIYIVTRGVVHGRRGALMSVAGVEIGNYLEVVAASAGLAAIIASSATAFTAVKLAGAAYLIWLGIRTLMEGAVEGEELMPARTHRRLFWQGFAVGALNPKLAIFLLAFLPQFIEVGAGPVWLQTLALGTIFSLTAVVGDTLIALAASRAGSTLRTRLTRRGRLSRAAGVVYIGLGITAALAGDPGDA